MIYLNQPTHVGELDHWSVYYDYSQYSHKPTQVSESLTIGQYSPDIYHPTNPDGATLHILFHYFLTMMLKPKVMMKMTMPMIWRHLCLVKWNVCLDRSWSRRKPTRNFSSQNTRIPLSYLCNVPASFVIGILLAVMNKFHVWRIGLDNSALGDRAVVTEAHRSGLCPPSEPPSWQDRTSPNPFWTVSFGAWERRAIEQCQVLTEGAR